MPSPWEYPLDIPHILRHYRRRLQTLRTEAAAGRSLRIAVLGGSTTAQLPELLAVFLLERGLDARFYEGGYDQYRSAALAGDADLAEFDPDVIYLHTTCRNIDAWPCLADDAEQTKRRVEEEIGRWEIVWQGLHQKNTRALIIQNLFEYPQIRKLGNQDGLDFHGETAFVRRLNREITAAAQDKPWLCLHDLEYLSARLGLDRWYDDSLWHAYKYAVSMDALVEIAHSLASVIAAQMGCGRKAIVTDLDNTLWGGVIGEDGPERIKIGRETPEGAVYSDLQRYLAALASRGILLAVASKNDEAIAESGLNHPDSVLKKTDFAVFCANWRPKSDNIRDIARQLNIGLDSLVFLDDNPVERAQVALELPMVAIPDIGEDCTGYVRHLERNGWFDPATVSIDDLARSSYYAGNAAREELAAAADSYGEFLLSLAMQAEIAPFNPLYLERLTQLINKTNQFNLTTLRLTQTEVSARIDSPQWLTLYARLADRFGDNGLVAALSGIIQKDCLEIDLWLMSCRVLKRELEKAMLDELVRHCRQRGIANIIGRYRPSGKNAMVSQLYAELGFATTGEEANGDTFWQMAVSGYSNQNKVIEVNR